MRLGIRIYSRCFISGIRYYVNKNKDREIVYFFNIVSVM